MLINHASESKLSEHMFLVDRVRPAAVGLDEGELQRDTMFLFSM